MIDRKVDQGVSFLEKSTVDPFGIAAAFSRVNESWLRNLKELGDRTTELGEAFCKTAMEDLSRLLFENEGWKNPAENGRSALMNFVKTASQSARQYHSIFRRWLIDLVENAPGTDEKDRAVARFWIGQIISFLAPSNYFWMNPAAVQRFLESEGESLKWGVENWIEDVKRGDNLIKLADDSAFAIGGNIASTPGRVVYRNELMELIQYEPAVESTFAVPVVLVQPWINKYYIFDLSETNSFVRYLRSQGFTVFITSWKNPGPDMRHLTFEDYAFKGIRNAVDAAREICGVAKVHAAGYCIAGTALAAFMAWLNGEYENEGNIPIADWTLFSTLVDFSEPGDLGVFIGEAAIQAVETMMKDSGFLDSKFLATTFRLLNSDALIWRYVVNNYLFGQPPPKSDMLFWNGDSTRLPEAMCSFYLRELYLHNKLAQKQLNMGGRSVDLGTIRQPAYIVGAKQDHISPWKSTFKTCALVTCPVRYVLSSEGHITGIVNPPTLRSKKKVWAGDGKETTDPDDWAATREEVRGSWWADWVEWMAERSLRRGEPPPMGGHAYPPLEAAPGTYVSER